jgi:replication factor C large subunit
VRISKKEGFNIDERVFGKIADISEGDVRAAINDLQILTSSNNQILEKDVALLGFRERETEIFEALRRVLKTREALYAFDNVDLEPDKIILWLDENLPLEYQGKELERAYDVLSLADVYKTRIIRRQHWRFLVYVNYLISQGIAVAKKQEKQGFTRYQPPTRLLKLWIAKQKQAKRLEIAGKLAKFSHTSIKDSSKSMYLLKVACNNKDFLKSFSEQLRLNEVQIDWLKN